MEVAKLQTGSAEAADYVSFLKRLLALVTRVDYTLNVEKGAVQWEEDARIIEKFFEAAR